MNREPDLELTAPAVPVAAVKRKRAGRALDVLALLVIAWALWKILIAPRLFTMADKAPPAPPVAVATLAGPPFDLLAHRGEIVFIDFWASWCEPCKLSIPLIEHYVATHPNVTVISVNAGETVDVARRFALAQKMRNVGFDPDMSVTHAFAVNGFPTMVVIDPQGRERAKWVGFNPLIGNAMDNARKQFTKS